MASKHTPGPWVVGFDDGSGPTYITAGDVVVVAGGEDGWGIPQGVRSAQDARLIAAAPDLLKALTLAENWLTDMQKRPGMRLALQGAVDDARAAIQKATGEAASIGSTKSTEVGE